MKINNEVSIHALINSVILKSSRFKAIIKCFKQFYDKNKYNWDHMIEAMRNGGIIK